MTNAEFDAWARKHFPAGDAACGRALGIDREMVKALRLGLTKNGAEYPVRSHIELACAAWTMGVRSFNGAGTARDKAAAQLRDVRKALAAAIKALDAAI